MAKSRREFLTDASAGLLSAAGVLHAQGAKQEQKPATAQSASSPAGAAAADLPPGAPPTFGGSRAVGPEVSAETFEVAEKLVRWR